MEAKQISSNRTALWLLPLKLALAAALLTWLVRSGRLDFAAFKAVRLDWPLFGIIVSVVLMLVLQAWRWLLLLRARGIMIGARAVFQISFIGFFFSIFLPSVGGTEAVRMVYARPLARGAGYDLLATLILDRVIGVVGLSLMALGFGFLLWRNHPVHAVTLLFWMVVAGTVALMVFCWMLICVPPARLPRLLARWEFVRRMADALHEFRGHPQTLAAALLLSLLTHVAASLGACLAFVALGVSASVTDVFSLTPLINFIGNLPLTPMGLGVTDSAAVFLYNLTGIARAAEMTMLSRAALAAVSLVCGLACLIPVTRARSFAQA